MVVYEHIISRSDTQDKVLRLKDMPAEGIACAEGNPTMTSRHWFLCIETKKSKQVTDVKEYRISDSQAQTIVALERMG